MNNDDKRALNELKIFILDMLSRSNSTRAGSNLSIAPTIYTLFTRHLNYSPSNPHWINRSRVVLSTPNHSAAYYAMLHLSGFAISVADVKNYNSLNGILSPLAEKGIVPGIDISTGMPGIGISNAVGISLGEKYLKQLLMKSDPELKVIDYHTYCFCNDLDMVSSSASESLQYAVNMNLNKLILLYENNNLSQQKNVGNMKAKFSAIGLNVIEVKDSNNIKLIDRAFYNAKKSKTPSVIILNNKLGSGLINEGKEEANTIPVTLKEVEMFKQQYNYGLNPFEFSKDTTIYINSNIQKRMDKYISKWQTIFDRINLMGNESSQLLIKNIMAKNTDINFNSQGYNIADNYQENLTESNKKVINLFAQSSNLLLNIIIDQENNYNLFIKNSTEKNAEELGKNILLGSCHSIASGLANGLAALGFSVIITAPLNQLDSYLKGIRQTSLMNLPITYVFVRDTMFSQTDGPLYQPIEQINILRMMPNLLTFRPADIIELMGIWDLIIKNNRPAALVLSDEVVIKNPEASITEVYKGGYIAKSEKGHLSGVILATGNEASLAVRITIELEKIGLNIRVVSIPSLELFLLQNEEYRHQIIPNETKIVALEAGNTFLWRMFVHDKFNIIGLNEFGYNATSSELKFKMGFDYDNLKIKIARLFGANL